MASRLFSGAPLGAVLVLASGAFGSPSETPAFRMLLDVTNDEFASGVDYDWDDSNDPNNPFGFGALDNYGVYQVGEGDIQSNPFSGWRYSGTMGGLFVDQLGDPTGTDWAVQWNCVFDEATAGASASTGGAFVTANIVVTNNDVNPQTFTLLMTEPLSRVNASPLMRGSIAGTVTSLDINGATVAALSNSRIYSPRIDFSDETAGYLMADPFSASTGVPFGSAGAGPEAFGSPVPIAASQSADTNIQLFLEFEVSPNDQASFTAIFEILVPGPGSLPILAAFGLFAGRRRRRG